MEDNDDCDSILLLHVLPSFPSLLNQCNMCQVLGVGAFSTVVLAKDLITFESMALKVIKKTRLNEVSDWPHRYDYADAPLFHAICHPRCSLCTKFIPLSSAGREAAACRRDSHCTGVHPVIFCSGATCGGRLPVHIFQLVVQAHAFVTALWFVCQTPM